MSIPDLVTPADMLGKSIYADRARKADQINARHRGRMAQIIQERDDLKLVLDRQNPWNEKAQELLDASRWAGHTLIEGCVTELKETRAELGQEVERVAVIEERFVDLDKERDRLEHQLETTRTENELLRAALAEARESLRDRFAMGALGHIPALLAANERNRSVEQIALWSYEVADALLDARKGGAA